MQTLDSDSLLYRQMEVFRNFYKTPVMTKGYYAGWPAFLEWAGVGGKLFTDKNLWQTMVDAELVDAKDLEIHPEGVPEVIYKLGKTFHLADFRGGAGVLNAAMGLEKYRAQMEKVLAIDSRYEADALSLWESQVDMFVGETLPDNHIMRRIDKYKRQWEANLLLMAGRRGISVKKLREENLADFAKVDKVFERVNNRIEEKGGQFNPDVDDMTDAEVGEMMTHLSPKKRLEGYCILTRNKLF